MQMTRSEWFLPLFSVAPGLAILAAMAIGGELGLGSCRWRSCPALER